MKKIFTAIFLLFVFCCTIKQTQAQVLVSDSIALVNLYDSCNGVNWQRHDNWLTANPVSTWYGITVTGNRVTTISLPLAGNLQNHATGPIPYTLGNLTALQVLINGYDPAGSVIHGFSGPIPPSFANLTQLRWLDLGNNLDVSGSIPDFIGSFNDLTTIILNNNNLTGNIPDTLRALKKLKTLELSSNALQGNIPEWIGTLDSLTVLWLSHNMLDGPIPNSIGSLDSLQSLDLSSNPFTGGIVSIPDTLRNCKRLSFLALNNININDTIPAWIPALQYLGLLEMANDSLKGQLPVFVNDISTIDLGNNQLTGPLPAAYPAYDLAHLDLSNNQLSGIVPDNWKSAANSFVDAIRLDHNHFSGPIPYSLGFLTPSLDVEPQLYNNNFTSVPSSFQHQFLSILSYNNLRFDSLEQVIVANPSLFILATPQAIIPLHLNGNTFSVYAGGTLANNTYSWYKNNVLYQTITGDSTLTVTENGNYFVTVSNNIVTPPTGLILNSDTLLANVVLPLTLLNFTGQLQNERVLLKWQTANEINTKDFIVERSSNANNFSAIGIVNADGASSIANTYNYADNSPLQGNNYYRLKMEDVDGKFTYSNVIRVNTDKNSSLALYPVPAQNTITISGAESFTLIQFIDASGRVVKQVGKQPANIFNIKSLTAGVYYIRLSSGISTKVLKMIKE